MDSYEFKVITLCFAICVLIVGGGLYFAMLEEEQEGVWAAKCEQAGGMPSKYHTMVGKTSHSERLCIKKENVVEVEP